MEATYRPFTNSVVLEIVAGDEIHLQLLTGHSAYDNANNRGTFSRSLFFPSDCKDASLLLLHGKLPSNQSKIQHSFRSVLLLNVDDVIS